MTLALQSHTLLQELADDIARELPDAVLSDISDEPSMAYSTMSIHLPNAVHLSVGNDFDTPASHFMVMRTSSGYQRLPFEGAFEDGYGVTEKLTKEGVLTLLQHYARLRTPTPAMH